MTPFLRTSLICVALTGCGMLPAGIRGPQTDSPAPAVEGSGQTRPVARPTTLNTIPAKAPPANARTAEQFDTTTQADRKQAAAAPADPGGEQRLGSTVASLGDPSKPGFWLETPLVKAAATGRVTFGGKSSQVDLIPIDGPATGGSRISLAAMRLIGAPLTGLPEIEVFTGG